MTKWKAALVSCLVVATNAGAMPLDVSCGLNFSSEEESAADCREKLGDRADVCTIENIAELKAIPCGSFEGFARNNFTVRHKQVIRNQPRVLVQWKEVRSTFSTGIEWNDPRNLLNWLPAGQCSSEAECRNLHDLSGEVKRSKLCYARWNANSRDIRRISCGDAAVFAFVGLDVQELTLEYQDSNGVRGWRDYQSNSRWIGPFKRVGGMGGFFTAQKKCESMGDYRLPRCGEIAPALRRGLQWPILSENRGGLDFWCETPSGPAVVRLGQGEPALAPTDPVFQSNDLMCVSKGAVR